MLGNPFCLNAHLPLCMKKGLEEFSSTPFLEKGWGGATFYLLQYSLIHHLRFLI